MDAVILAGGKSSRMGRNKAFLELDGKTFLQRQLELLRDQFDNVMISANSNHDYNTFNAPVLNDIMPEKGPIGGIYTGLVNSTGFYTFFFACDMPFLDKGLIDRLKERAKGVDVVAPQNGGMMEPLHAIYSKNCIEPIKRQIEKNDLKITNFFEQVKVNLVKIDKLELSKSYKNSLTNMNTPDDIKRLNC